jgi:hypothetical protein
MIPCCVRVVVIVVQVLVAVRSRRGTPLQRSQSCPARSQARHVVVVCAHWHRRIGLRHARQIAARNCAPHVVQRSA